MIRQTNSFNSYTLEEEIKISGFEKTLVPFRMAVRIDGSIVALGIILTVAAAAFASTYFLPLHYFPSVASHAIVYLQNLNMYGASSIVGATGLLAVSTIFYGVFKLRSSCSALNEKIEEYIQAKFMAIGLQSSDSEILITRGSKSYYINQQKITLDDSFLNYFRSPNSRYLRCQSMHFKD